MTITWRRLNEAWKKIIHSRSLRFSDANSCSAIAAELSNAEGGSSREWDKTNSGRSFGYAKTTTVKSASSYTGTDDDFYIGVASDKASTIYLPAAARNGKIIIIKAEMRPPIGTRKIHVVTTDGSTIDGYDSTSIRISYGSLVMIRNNDNWFTIS